jgi:hypothetical protein
MDTVMGVTAGHEETLRWIEAFIDHIEDGRPFPELSGEQPSPSPTY